jgi:hypothetical protein
MSSIVRTPAPIDSDALRANIASTAQEVVVPDRYLPLVAAVEGLHGVRASLSETMREYFHTYRNADLLVDGFQAILLRNWSYFERSDDRCRLSELVAELVLGLLDGSLTHDQFSLLLRSLLMWCGGILDGRYCASYDDALKEIGRSLTRLLPLQLAAFLERDVLLRNLVERTARRPALAPVFGELYRGVLLASYRQARDRLDVPGWAAGQVGGLTEPDVVAERFDFLDRSRLAGLLDTAEKASGERLRSAESPLLSDLIERAIDQRF